MQMEIYPRIRNLREDSDLTQQQVGKAINVPQRTYAYYESGQRMVPPHVLCALADYYKVSVDFILGRTDKKKYNLLFLVLQSFAKKYTIRL
jgi:transcriptional regulator with XRE-family HTH domain